MISHTELIARDRARLTSTLAGIVSPGQKYALIDFPDYSNVGDSLIWLGSMRLLQERMGQDPSYSCSWDYSKEQLVAAIDDGPIFLQGGGNFGDIYPDSQNLKLRIIQENPERQIIQMPQSIKFRDEGNASETRKTLQSHKRHTMLVRDKKSAAFCETVLGVPATLTPDAAFGLGPVHRDVRDPNKILALMRDDDEMISRDLSALIASGAEPVDWLEDEPNFEFKSKLAGRTRALLTGRLSLQARRLVSFKIRAERRLNRGAALLSQRGVIVTDRLHAHILSVLLGLPNVCLDNDYGKIHSYIDAFTGDWSGVHKASSVEQAATLARSALAERAK